MEKNYDFAIIGSGLGGLICANILLLEGYNVVVIEKNNQFGGNLQTFSRDKRIFDTGVHYIGSLDKGEHLYKIFSYLGIYNELKLKKMDETFDFISFDGDPNQYPYSQGKDNFVKNLLEFFPEEREALEKYIDLIEYYCFCFPLHNLEKREFCWDKNLSLMEKKADEVINSLTQNTKLRAVLSGINFLYAGEKDTTPFYVHALIVNSYLNSAWRCRRGGSQIAKLLTRNIRHLGGKLIKNTKVEEIVIKNTQVEYLKLSDDKEIYSKNYISGIDARQLLTLFKGDSIKKSYYKRINENKDTISSFSLFLTLKPETILYRNANQYHFKNEDRVWEIVNYSENSWPEGYMISFSADEKNEAYAKEMTILTYMHFKEVKQWENSFNTISNKSERGPEYEKFKNNFAERLLDEVEQMIPGLKDSIIGSYTSTPLTYRDYIGTSSGGMYGFVKDASNPMQSFLLPQTKLKNLFLTGQSTGLHGIYGVAIGSILTCSEFIGKDYLLDKINSSD
ncbi:NAD(P)/FAD-dependent oxidoreductase [Apibacter sp. HY039]|uniref:phytoene desaturase family protein n=1 Tax=Apibacter sp. HY039 TaxID=2501476 RepID=UPI000FEBBE18|nr:NAD(P)/FAD-dependent oxidoreductase [Apibacter sp. HY039]